jgi:tetratricopeptide (TPR) repeat protein
VFTSAANTWFHGLTVGHLGQYERAIADLQETLRYSERAGDLLFPMRAYNSLGWVYAELENHELALGHNLRSVDAAVAAGLPDPEVEMNARLNVADNLLALGRPRSEAQEHLSLVERVVRHPEPPERWMLWRYSQHYFHTQGELSLAEGHFEKALTLADECIALATETGVLKNIVKGRRLRGQALVARGDLEAAQTELTAALDLAREVGNPGQLWKTHAAIGDLHIAANRGADAREAYAAALTVLEDVAASLADMGLRETLLASASVARLRAQLAP